MAFDYIEVSNDLGKHIFLYEFVLNETVWAYTSSAFEMLIGGLRYVPMPISDDGIKQAGDASSDLLSITLPSTAGVAQMFVGTPPSSPVIVRIRHAHEGDGEAPVVYVGEISQVDDSKPGTAVVQCLAVATSIEREGLRLGWQRTCPYAVYDPATCKANKAAHAIPAVLIFADHAVVKAAAFASVPNGRLNGGFIEWEHPVRGRETRGIEEHVGDTVTIFGPTDGLYYGLRVTAYPGCDLRTETCLEVFDNLDNYGGVPHMPGRSPFDGNPIF